MYKSITYILLAASIFSNLNAKDIIQPQSLFQMNRVYSLTDNALLESTNGFDKAVVDIVPIEINPNAFSFLREPGSNSPLYVGQEVILELPGQAGEVTLQVATLDQNIGEGYYTYSGKLKDINNSSFVITTHNQIMDGQIVIKNQLYNLKYISEEEVNNQTLTWIDRNLIDTSHFKNDFSVAEKDTVAKQNTLSTPKLIGNPKIIKSSNSNPVIRALFLYGSDVPNYLTLTSNIVSKMNTVFSNSQINKHKISVADIEVLNTDFGTDCRFDIEDDMNNKVGAFSNLDTKVANTYADIVVVVAKGDVPFPCDGNPFDGRIGGIGILYS